MTQTLEKQEINVERHEKHYNTLTKNRFIYRSKVLNCLFRNISFIPQDEGKIRAISQLGYSFISNSTGISRNLVHSIVSRFLVDLIRFRKFLVQFPEVLNSNNHSRKVRIYLHKLYRLAPIFDYKRAKENAYRLHLRLKNIYLQPQIMTQLAVVIYITDVLDRHYSQEILQTNLRALCSCSAYAFHRTRNKVGLTSNYIKNLKKELL